MSDSPEPVVAVVVRIATPGLLTFQLRKGEQGISVFDPDGVDPPLTDEEILAPFRPGSVVVYRPVSLIEGHGMLVIPVAGADVLPARLRIAHRELHRGPG